MNTFFQYAFSIGHGLTMTLGLTASGFCLGLSLAILTMGCRKQFLLGRLISALCEILRGTPLLLQLALIYFALPALLSIHLSVFLTGLLTLGLNSFAYLSEILRAGIESIPKGQIEAAKTLRIPLYAIWTSVIFPQAIRHVLPALTCELVMLLKETALISTLGGMDIMRTAQSLAAENFNYFLPLSIAAIYYYVITALIEKGGKYIEAKVAIC